MEVSPPDSPKDQSKQRSSRACDACRKRKVRCDGLGSNGEACALCTQTGTACTFAHQTSRRGPPKSYVAALERRLQAMEALLQSLSTTTSSPNADDEPLRNPNTGPGIDSGATQQGVASFPDITSSTSTTSQPNGATLDSIDQLVEELDELSVDHDRYVGRGSGLHLARSIGAVGPHNAFDVTHEPPSLVERVLSDEHRQGSQVFPLPPVDLGHKLVDAYFSNYDRTWCMLHRAHFERQLASGKLETDLSFRSLYFILCALGARTVDDDRLRTQGGPGDAGSQCSRGFDFFKASAACASPLLVSATLCDIQASALSVMWLMGAASPISAWAATGFAIRRIVDVGAHRENRSRWTSSPIEDQLRRRAFYVLVGMDRVISASLGRPLALHDEDFDLREPLDLSDDELDLWELAGKGSPPVQSNGGFYSGAKSWRGLTRITGMILRSLYGMRSEAQSAQKIGEQVQYLDSLLNAWLETVPERSRWNQAEENEDILAQAGALYVTYYATQILVHREFLSPQRAKVHGFPSLAICSNAARSIANILDVLRQRKILDRLFWLAPLAAATAALILLINVFAGGGKTSYLTSSARKDVKRCVDVLAELSDSTFVARKTSLGLSRLLASDDAVPASLKTNTGLKRGAADEWPDSASPISSTQSSQSSPGTSAGPEDEAQRAHRNKHKQPKRNTDALPFSTSDLSQTTFNGRPTFSTASAMAEALAASTAAAAAAACRLDHSGAGFPQPDTASQADLSGASNPAAQPPSANYGVTVDMFNPPVPSAQAPAFTTPQQPSADWLGNALGGGGDANGGAGLAFAGQTHADLLASLGGAQPASWGLSSGGSPGVGFGSSLNGFDWTSLVGGYSPPVAAAAASSRSASNTVPSNVAPIDAALYNMGSGSNGSRGSAGGGSAVEASESGSFQIPLTPLNGPGSRASAPLDDCAPWTLPTSAAPADLAFASTATATTPSMAADLSYTFSSTGLTPGANGMSSFWDPSLFGDYDFGALAEFKMDPSPGQNPPQQ